MKTTPVIATLLGRSLTDGQSSTSVANKDSWLKTLFAGQILKGRILRYYGDSRYGVYFSGQERIVDSAVPLSVGDIISGKVIGISEDAVSLQVIHAVKSEQAEISEKSLPQPTKVEDHSTLHSLMKQAGLELDPSQLQIIENTALGSENPEIVFNTGLFLAKLGLPLTMELVRTLSKRLIEPPRALYQSLEHDIPKLISQPLESVPLDESPTTSLIAKYFSEYHRDMQTALEEELSASISHQISEENLESHGGAGSSTQHDHAETHRLLFFCLSQILNKQTDAAYQHRFESLPIIIDGKIMEFDLALFDHSAKEHVEDRVRSRHLKFSLETYRGAIVVDANVFNNRINVHFSTESEWAAKEFELYQGELQLALGDAGWILESAHYGSDLKRTSPAAGIVEHVLAQDSLRITM